MGRVWKIINFPPIEMMQSKDIITIEHSYEIIHNLFKSIMANDVEWIAVGKLGSVMHLAYFGFFWLSPAVWVWLILNKQTSK